jgi:hypothetical protein
MQNMIAACQMYASNTFNNKEMTDWENKPKIIKNNFDKAKLYFEGLIMDYKMYKQNSGGTVSKSKYNNANQVKETNKGDKLREYIAQIATAAVACKEQQVKLIANLCNMDNAKSKETLAMTSQIKSLTNAKKMAPTTQRSSTLCSGSFGWTWVKEAPQAQWLWPRRREKNKEKRPRKASRPSRS